MAVVSTIKCQYTNLLGQELEAHFREMLVDVPTSGQSLCLKLAESMRDPGVDIPPGRTGYSPHIFMVPTYRNPAIVHADVVEENKILRYWYGDYVIDLKSEGPADAPHPFLYAQIDYADVNTPMLRIEPVSQSGVRLNVTMRIPPDYLDACIAEAAKTEPPPVCYGELPTDKLSNELITGRRR